MALLAGCTRFDPQPAQLDPADIPDRFSLYSETAENSPEWWREFNSEELTGLIETAIQDNFSIREAWSRLEQARSTARKTTARNYPDLSGSIGDTYTDQKNKDQVSTSSNTWSLGLWSDYEIDLWGRVQAENKSMDLQTRASVEDVNTAIISVSGQIAEVWTSLISSRRQQALYEKQLEIHNELLKLLQFRLARAQSTSLDIYQQQQSVEKLKTSLLQITTQQELYRRQLALLCGKTSLNTPLESHDFPVLKKIPSVGLPADLLAARPDIRAAGLRLQSSQWQVAAAQADRLPALKLSAYFTYSDEQLQSIFDNWLLSLAGSLAGPIFDAGRKEAEIDRTKSLFDERLLLYREKVFNAVKEVEDALSREFLHKKTLTSLHKQIRLSEATLQEAVERYLNGNNGFLNVLKEELELQQLQQQYIITQENLIIARINLYKALGGARISKTD
jgi:NodT family efflux transporter outer membrane factor (OMF) lipoprotein